MSEIKMVKKTDVAQLKRELEEGRAASPDGLIHPSERVKWAAKHPNSVLYKSLNWDDKQLGHNARCRQVQEYMTFYFRDADDQKELVVLMPDIKVGRGGYRPLKSVKGNRDLFSQLQQDIFDEMWRFRQKNGWITRFSQIWNAIDKMAKEFRKPVPKVATRRKTLTPHTLPGLLAKERSRRSEVKAPRSRA